MRPAANKGSALLAVLIAMAVLAVLAAAAIMFTGNERAATAASANSQELRACIDVARAHVLARLRTTGANVNLEFVGSLPDGPEDAGTTVRTGHFDSVAVKTVSQITRGVGEAANQPNDLANNPGARVTKASYYRVVVACQKGPRQSEAEFLVRYGL